MAALTRDAEKAQAGNVQSATRLLPPPRQLGNAAAVLIGLWRVERGKFEAERSRIPALISPENSARLEASGGPRGSIDIPRAGRGRCLISAAIRTRSIDDEVSEAFEVRRASRRGGANRSNPSESRRRARGPSIEPCQISKRPAGPAGKRAATETLMIHFSSSPSLYFVFGNGRES